MKTLLSKLLITFFLLFLSFHSNGRSIETIMYNSDTKSFESELPYDRPFNIKLEMPSDFKYILLVEHCRGMNLCDSYSCSANKELKEFPEYHYWDTTEEGQNYLYIRFGQDPYNDQNFFLEPLKNYTLLFLDDHRGVIDIIKRYNEYFINEDNKILDALKKEYKDLYEKQNCASVVFWPECEDFFDTLKHNYNDPIIKSNLTTYNDLNLKIKKSYEGANNLVQGNVYNDLTKFILSLDSISLLRLGIKPLEMNVLLHSLSLMDANEVNEMLTGKKKLSKKEILGSIQIITSNLIHLEECLALARYYEIILGKPVSNVFEEALKEFITLIKGNIEIFTKLNSLDSEIIDRVLSESGSLIDYINGHTIAMDFKERLKIRFTPDLGLINYGFQESFNQFSPYIGFHYNLKYLDRDILFHKTPNKNLFHYLSINLGWAFNSIEEDNKRKGLIEDGSLMTGLGIRINHTFRITGGKNWFYKIDENPLSNRKSIASSNYLGISVDFEVYELLNGFTKIFKK